MSKTEIHENTELLDVARLFFCDDVPQIFIEHDCASDTFTTYIGSAAFVFDCKNSDFDIIPLAHKYQRLAKIALYDALCAYTQRTMPWGALTGIRPTKLFYECMRSGCDSAEAERLMRDIYRVSPYRAEILGNIVAAQRGKVNFSDEFVNLYVHIPYCTTRCTYCSFVSAPIGKCRDQSVKYVDLLCKEIEATKKAVADSGKRILSVYIGGGTPTALDPDTFDKLLCSIGTPDCEYTCEAGRPDTVTAKMCDIMRSHGVTRVCVNPQTLNDKTLPKIGRSHSVDDFYASYECAKKCGFDINCDLIAGLCDETADDFKASFDGIIALAPENLTVHSLSKKNGSEIRYEHGENSDVSGMLDYALKSAGRYVPYYLYRQKRQAGNLENVGFSLPGKECVNNITVMEETVSVHACGAGAISKFIYGNNIGRFANMRDIGLYISRFDEKLKAKLDYFYSTL